MDTKTDVEPTPQGHPYRATLLQGAGWHVIGPATRIYVTAQSVALALARQMNSDYQRERRYDL